MLEKECSCQLVVQPDPLSFGNWYVQVGEHEQEQATGTLRKAGTNPTGTLRPFQSQALILQLGQAALYHSLLWNAIREHDQILLEGLRRNGVLNFPLPVSPLCSWGMEHGNRALPRVMQEMLGE